MVRGNLSGVEHMHAVLPACAASGLHLCALAAPSFCAAATGNFPLGGVSSQPHVATHSPERKLENCRYRPPLVPHPGAARVDRGASVFPALLHQSAIAGLVRAPA